MLWFNWFKIKQFLNSWFTNCQLILLLLNQHISNCGLKPKRQTFLQITPLCVCDSCSSVGPTDIAHKYMSRKHTLSYGYLWLNKCRKINLDQPFISHNHKNKVPYGSMYVDHKNNSKKTKKLTEGILNGCLTTNRRGTLKDT